MTLTVILWMGCGHYRKVHCTNYCIDITVMKIHEPTVQMPFHMTNVPCTFYCLLMHPSVNLLIEAKMQNNQLLNLMSPNHLFQTTFHKSYSEWALNHWRVQHYVLQHYNWNSDCCRRDDNNSCYCNFNKLVK